MKGKKYPFDFMSGTYERIMEELKCDDSRVSFRNVKMTVGLSTNCLLRLKKGLM